jgi:hypothetical protein
MISRYEVTRSYGFCFLFVYFIGCGRKEHKDSVEDKCTVEPPQCAAECQWYVEENFGCQGVLCLYVILLVCCFQLTHKLKAWNSHIINSTIVSSLIVLCIHIV